MQPERAAKRKPRLIRFFLYGGLFEILLLALAYALPESWLSIEIKNFVLVTHYPLMIGAMWVMDTMNFQEGPVSGVLAVAMGFVIIASAWGMLIYLVSRVGALCLARVTLRLKIYARRGLLAVVLVLLVCGIISMLPETPRPFESSAEIRSVVDANNAFATDLYQKLKDNPGNLFFSPYSISTSLAMTSAGARGQTETEMTNALHFSLPPEKLHPAFKALMARMNAVQRWNRIVLKPANSLWVQKDHPFTADFLKLIQENYSAGAESGDFKNFPGAVADEMNRWMDAKTDHKIKNGIAPGQLTPDTKLALCNAIYFKGKWLNQFKPGDTRPAPFHVTTNETLTIPMMWQHAEFRYEPGPDEEGSFEMLELPYSGRDLSMVILLPRKESYLPDEEPHDLSALEHKLTAENLRLWLKKLDGRAPGKTSVWLPRFTTTSSFDLATNLKSLGMVSAFDATADFSGMDGTKNLFLSDVFHKTFVEVNEKGTEAAAVSIALVKTKGMSDRFNVDHPFIFLIRENGSGSILFMGRIIDPTK